MNNVSMARYSKSLLLIAADVSMISGEKLKPSRVLRWERQFRKHGGYFQRDLRGVQESVQEREFSLHEEDL